MSLKNVSNAELTARLEKLVRSERKITHLVLIHIVEIESRKIYAALGFDGMFSYLTKGLGYSESAAYRRLLSARLLSSLPAVAEKIEDGSLNLSQLTQVQKCLKSENKNYDQQIKKFGGGSALAGDIYQSGQKKRSLELILSKIENKNSFETKKILAIEFDQPIENREIVTPQKDESVRIQLTFTKEQFEALEEVKSLISHSIHNNSLPEVIHYLAINYLKKKNGNESGYKTINNNGVWTAIKGKSTNGIENDVKSGIDSGNKAQAETEVETETQTGIYSAIQTDEQRDKQKDNQRNKQIEIQKECFSGLSKMTHGFAATKTKRAYLSAKIKRSVMAGAKHACQFMDKSTGRKCDSKYQLQIDHIHPRSKGGLDNTENLQVLCRAHNHFKGARFL